MIDIEAIKDATDILDLISSDETHLRQVGNQWRSGHYSAHTSTSGRYNGTSLVVDPSKQLWKCFECNEGGSAIDWIMKRDSVDFITALRHLAQRQGIQLAELTDYQKTELKSSRNVRSVIKQAFRFYHSQLTDDHRAYLHNRGIDNETIDELLIGYAPAGGSALRDHLKSQEIKSADALATGLFHKASQRAYDHYQDRIVFPYWRGGEILYSIARLPIGADLEARYESDRSKYKKHLLHSEKRPHISRAAVRHTLYGIDSIRNASEIIVTEGIVDAILAHQAGFACLSPITTRINANDIDQILQYSKRADRVVLINDSETNDAGRKGALDTAEAHFKAEMIDTKVVTLPRPDGTDKIDLADFLNVPEAERDSRVAELCELIESAPSYLDLQLETIKDAVSARQPHLIEKLIDVSCNFKPIVRDAVMSHLASLGTCGRSALNEQLKISQKKAQSPKVESEQTADRSERAITEDHEQLCYVKHSVDRFGMPVSTTISSFIIEPKTRVWLDRKENITADFKSTDRSYNDELIERDAWNDKRAFMNSFPSVDLQFSGSLNDIQDILGIVASKDVPTKQGTIKLGRHDSGVWILPNGVAYGRNGIVTDHDLVYLPRGGHGELDDRISIRTDIDESVMKPFLFQIGRNLPLCNVPEVTIPTIGWFFATPFRPFFKQIGFPHLSVSGTAGAGKTSFLAMMWRLLGVSGVSDELFHCESSNFVMLKLLSSTTSIPILLDEYKPYDMKIDRRKALSRYLRCAYDGITEFRGRPDLSTVAFDLTAPIALAGEVALNETALLERIIPVQLSLNQIDPEMRSYFHRLQREPLNALMHYYIPFVLRTDFGQEWQVAKSLTSELVGNIDLADRVRNNITTMLFGFNQFQRFTIEHGVMKPNGFSAEIDRAVTEMVETVAGGDGVTKTAFDYMIEHFAIMADTGRIVYDRDYSTDEDEGLIFIKLGNCLAEFRKFHRETQLDDEMLNATAYRRQIKENYDRNGYVVEISARQRFGGAQYRVTVIDSNRTDLNLNGFFGNNP